MFIIYGDKLILFKDLNTLKAELGGEVIKIRFGGKFSLGKYLTDKSEPIIFCRFVGGYLDNVYNMANKLSYVKDKENQALSEYNDQNTRMDLILFDDEVKHYSYYNSTISTFNACWYQLIKLMFPSKIYSLNNA